MIFIYYLYIINKKRGKELYMKINKQKIIEVEVIVEPIIDEAIPSGKGNYDDQTLVFLSFDKRK